MKLRDLLVRNRLENYIRDLLESLPFQLSDLWVYHPEEELFTCSFCMVKNPAGDQYYYGKGHKEDNLNKLSRAQGSLWDLMSRNNGNPVEYISDINDPNQLSFSIYRDWLTSQDNHFKLLEEAYPNLFIFNTIKQIYRLKDLSVIRLFEPDGNIAGIIRLFNQLVPKGRSALPQQEILSYVSQILIRLSFIALDANAKPLEVEDLGDVLINRGVVHLRSANAQMIDLFKALRRVADGNSTALISGESGTGKEIIARWIHQHGTRSDRPFVPLNVSAIPATLLESELFGSKKGSFTSSVTDNKGLLQTAESGTVFLDEIGEFPLELQSKLLRVLQEKEFMPIGGRQHVPLLARVIAATNKDLSKEVKEGRFRKDLLHRLNTVHLHIPSLRDRKEDIPLILDELLKQSETKVGLTDEARSELLQRPWSDSNVREMQNYLAQLRIWADDPERVTMSDIRKADRECNRSMDILDFEPASVLTWAKSRCGSLDADVKPLTLITAYLVYEAVRICGSQNAAAIYLGVSPNTVQKYLGLYSNEFKA